MDSSEDLPAGSLKFDNDHTVPHEISIEVLNVELRKVNEETDTIPLPELPTLQSPTKSHCDNYR